MSLNELYSRAIIDAYLASEPWPSVIEMAPLRGVCDAIRALAHLVERVAAREAVSVRAAPDGELDTDVTLMLVYRHLMRVASLHARRDVGGGLTAAPFGDAMRPKLELVITARLVGDPDLTSLKARFVYKENPVAAQPYREALDPHLILDLASLVVDYLVPSEPGAPICLKSY